MYFKKHLLKKWRSGLRKRQNVEEELAYAEEPEEERIEELVEEEEVIEEIEEEVIVASEEKSSISKEMALNVVSSTLAQRKLVLVVQLQAHLYMLRVIALQLVTHKFFV